VLSIKTILRFFRSLSFEFQTRNYIRVSVTSATTKLHKHKFFIT